MLAASSSCSSSAEGYAKRHPWRSRPPPNSERSQSPTAGDGEVAALLVALADNKVLQKAVAVRANVRSQGFRCPRRLGLAHVHRIGVELARCNGDDVRHDGSLFPFPRSGLMPEGKEPRSCCPSSREAAGQRGKGTNGGGSPPEWATQNPPRSYPRRSCAERPIFPLQGRGAARRPTITLGSSFFASANIGGEY